MNTRNKKLCLGPLLVCSVVIIRYRQKMADRGILPAGDWDSGKVVKKSRLKKPYSQRSVPSGQPGGLWIMKYGLFYHKDWSDIKLKSLGAVPWILMKKLNFSLQTINLKNTCFE